MSYRKGRNPELDRTYRDDPSKMAPRKDLKDEDGEMICCCTGARFAAIKCLEGLANTSQSSELVKKKRACAQGVLSDVRLLG